MVREIKQATPRSVTAQGVARVYKTRYQAGKSHLSRSLMITVLSEWITRAHGHLGVIIHSVVMELVAFNNIERFKLLLQGRGALREFKLFLSERVVKWCSGGKRGRREKRRIVLIRTYCPNHKE